MQKDTLLVTLSDLHTGSNYALFPNRFWQGKEGVNHTPTSDQEKIHNHFVSVAKNIKINRKGKKIVLVVDGDAIEGIHHNNIDVCTRDVGEQIELHIELMLYFQKLIGWTRGDKLYYVTGTETHTGQTENAIGEAVGAQQYPDGWYTTSHLQLEINGKIVWFAHRGVAAGKGVSEGNALRNWLRDVYYDARKIGKPTPDIVYLGHVHNPTYEVKVINDNYSFRKLHGIILPSWQMKTRYAYGVAPVSANMIGAVTQEIRADGEIRIPTFLVTETQSTMKVTA